MTRTLTMPHIFSQDQNFGVGLPRCANAPFSRRINAAAAGQPIADCAVYISPPMSLARPRRSPAAIG
jgi:hypothetical protein